MKTALPCGFYEWTLF